MRTKFHERARLDADRKVERTFKGDTCTCGGSRYYTKSDRCLKCIQLSTGSKRSAALKARQSDEFFDFPAMHKGRLMYQRWGI